MKPLRLDVTISQVPVAGGNHPVLLPSDWVRTIDRFGLWDCLFGTSDYGAGQLMLEDFWRKFGTVYGDFEGLKENIPARQLLPILYTETRGRIINGGRSWSFNGRVLWDTERRVCWKPTTMMSSATKQATM